MVSLVDVGPLTDKVPFRGEVFEVQGLTALVIFELLRDIPELRRLMADKKLDEDAASSLISQLPHAVGAIIAASLGKFGDAPTIAAAMNMSAGEQLLFIKPILRLTFPQGIQSFLEGLFELVPQGARGWDQATRSPAPSSSVSAQDTESETAGSTPPDSSPPGAS